MLAFIVVSGAVETVDCKSPPGPRDESTTIIDADRFAAEAASDPG
jgi:hypothetical protein